MLDEYGGTIRATIGVESDKPNGVEAAKVIEEEKEFDMDKILPAALEAVLPPLPPTAAAAAVGVTRK